MADINYIKPDKLEDFSAWCSKKYPLWCKSNFPFIEDTFEALDTYGLICKIVQYLNETKQNLNTTEDNVQNIYDFVSNYFDDLNVQTEINNKLDEMTNNGTLEDIINQEIFGDINKDIKLLKRNAIYIGNSYTAGIGSISNQGIFALTKDMFDEAFMFTGSGTGFLPYHEHETDTFITLLNNAINSEQFENDIITDVIVVGAWGETRAYREMENDVQYVTAMQTALNTFVNLCKNNFTNLKRISYVFAESRATKTAGNIEEYPNTFSDCFSIHNLMKFLLPQYKIDYLGWIGFNILLREAFFSDDLYHPDGKGYNILSGYFKNAYCGSNEYRALRYNFSNTTELIEDGYISGDVMIEPSKVTIRLLNGILPRGKTTPEHGAQIKLIDFINNNFVLPMTQFATNIDLASNFNVITKSASSDTFSINDIIFGKLALRLDSEDLTSNNSYIEASIFGNSKTTTGEIRNLLIGPNLIEYSLDRR